MLKTYRGSCHCGAVMFEAELTQCLFHTNKNQHWFFRHCGERAFGVGTETPMGKMYGVDLGCFKGVSEEERSRVPIAYVDGRHDRFAHPDHVAHL